MQGRGKPVLYEPDHGRIRRCWLQRTEFGEPVIAEAVFGTAVITEPAGSPRPLLGVFLESGDGGVRIKRVMAESVAEKAGLEADDLIVEAAGTPVNKVEDVVKVVRRQAHGS